MVTPAQHNTPVYIPADQSPRWYTGQPGMIHTATHLLCATPGACHPRSRESKPNSCKKCVVVLLALPSCCLPEMACRQPLTASSLAKATRSITVIWVCSQPGTYKHDVDMQAAGLAPQ